MAYIEPAPIKDKENPFESMMSRFHIASQALGLDDEVYNVLKSPAKQVEVSLPITMDDGSLKVFEGFRVTRARDKLPSILLSRLLKSCAIPSASASRD